MATAQQQQEKIQASEAGAKRMKARRARRGFAKRRNPYVAQKDEPAQARQNRHEAALAEQAAKGASIEQIMADQMPADIVERHRVAPAGEMRANELVFDLSQPDAAHASMRVVFDRHAATVKGDGAYGVMRTALDAAQVSESRRFWLHSLGRGGQVEDDARTTVQCVVGIEEGARVAQTLYERIQPSA